MFGVELLKRRLIKERILSLLKICEHGYDETKYSILYINNKEFLKYF
jgi:hypothetical protein